MSHGAVRLLRARSRALVDFHQPTDHALGSLPVIAANGGVHLVSRQEVLAARKVAHRIGLGGRAQGLAGRAECGRPRLVLGGIHRKRLHVGFVRILTLDEYIVLPFTLVEVNKIRVPVQRHLAAQAVQAIVLPRAAVLPPICQAVDADTVPLPVQVLAEVFVGLRV